MADETKNKLSKRLVPLNDKSVDYSTGNQSKTTKHYEKALGEQKKPKPTTPPPPPPEKV